jgi:ABC-type branched-subunit amino acid transport system substrate-binding protein
MARTFAAIEAWAEASRESGSLAPGMVAAALLARRVNTSAAGQIAFDENGDARVPSYVPANWNGDAWVSGGDAP